MEFDESSDDEENLLKKKNMSKNEKYEKIKIEE
jgi:hypothetical protein